MGKKKQPIERYSRRAHGVIVSAAGLVGSLLTSVGAVIVGIVSGSIATIGSGINDLTDVVASITAMVGFRTAGRKRNAIYPQGYGRLEYVAGLVISIIVIFTSMLLVYFSVVKIFWPEPIDSSVGAIAVMVFSLMINGGLALYYHWQNRRLKSLIITTALWKGLGDVLVISAALSVLLFAPMTEVPIDGISGTLIGLFVFAMGIRTFIKNSQLLIGYRPEKNLRQKVRRVVLAAESFTSIRKMAFHDYGPTMREAVVMVRLKRGTRREKVEADIDKVKHKLKLEYGVNVTIYWPPGTVGRIAPKKGI